MLKECVARSDKERKSLQRLQRKQPELREKGKDFQKWSLLSLQGGIEFWAEMIVSEAYD